MSLHLVDEGKIKFLDWLRGNWGNTLKIKLFKSNTPPADGDTLATYTEADFSGYAEQTVTTWAAAAIVAGRASSTAAANVFSHNGGGTSNNIYGYLVYDPADNKLLWAEKDANAPIVMSNASHTYTVTPINTQKSEF